MDMNDKQTEKYLKELADNDRNALVDDDYFDKEIAPLIQKQRAKREERQRFFKRLALVTCPALIICITVVLSIWLTRPNPNPGDYLGIYDTKVSTVAEVNSHLAKTQISDDIHYVIRLYEIGSNKTVAFSVNHDIMSDVSFRQCNIEIAVDKNYIKKGFDGLDSGSFAILGHTVRYAEKASQRLYEGQTVNDFIIVAHLDTGAEIYYISYSEISVGAESGFQDFISQIINNKLQGVIQNAE
jgi:hypothetical protein